MHLVELGGHAFRILLEAKPWKTTAQLAKEAKVNPALAYSYVNRLVDKGLLKARPTKSHGMIGRPAREFHRTRTGQTTVRRGFKVMDACLRRPL